MSATNTKSRIAAAVQNTAVRGAIYVAIGLGIGQVFSYLLSLIGARALGPEKYGIFASMLALLLMGSVLAWGLQAAAAKRVVLADPEDRSALGMSILRWSAAAAGVVAAATAVISPLMMWLLHLDGPVLVILVALNLAPITVWGGLLGITQGRERNARLALIYAIGGIGRAVGGIALVIPTQSVEACLVGMAVGSWLATLASWIFTKPLITTPAQRLANFRPDVIHATHALFALFVLTNLDVLLARHFLTPASAGIYAAGSVVTKVAFWLPQFVATVAYPRMADHRRAQTLSRAAIAVVAIGTVTVVGVALMPNLVVAFVGGSAYQELASEVWIFAAIGASFALAQFLLYGQIAAGKRAAIAVLWIAVALLITLVWLFHASVLQIALIVLCVAMSLAAVGVIELVMEVRKEARSARNVG